MKARYLYIIILHFFISLSGLNGQTDNDPPVPPVLKLVTVNNLTNSVRIFWNPSTSADVSGYVIYSYRNNEGYSVDTLFDPSADSYTRLGSGSGYFSESYVVAALDSAGNISPLSNPLNTIYASASTDTCRNILEINWNRYLSFPLVVQNYSIMYSVDGSGFSEAGAVSADSVRFILNSFQKDVTYCFIVRANLEGGEASLSNNPCVFTKMQRPPEWINADYATITPDNEILLSFTIDPGTELKRFRLERETGNQGSFTGIYQFSSASGSLLYTDDEADAKKINYYRLSAINNCNIPVTVSNISSNIVLSLDRNEDDIKLYWNPYRKWNGGVDSYKINVKTGKELEERYSAGPADTVFHISYSGLMYEITSNEVCFMVKAAESSNPHTINGESRSAVICTPVSEVITVPSLFTPDNNGVNDLFRPVLSFTPVEYQLIITDISRKNVFETRDHSEEWDGTMNGNHLPEGVYLWFLRTRTPSNSVIERSGTVTIKFTR